MRRVSIRNIPFHRKRQRGAALVEAAVVMPVILIFYSLLVYCFNCYEMKVSQMAQTRHMAFSNAIHQCTDSRMDMEQSAVELGRVPAYASSEPARRMLAGSRLDTFLVERGMKTTATAKGTATTAPLSSSGLTRVVETSSQVHCIPSVAQQVLDSDESLAGRARRHSIALARRDDFLRSLADLLGL